MQEHDSANQDAATIEALKEKWKNDICPLKEKWKKDIREANQKLEIERVELSSFADEYIEETIDTIFSEAIQTTSEIIHDHELQEAEEYRRQVRGDFMLAQMGAH